MVVGSNPIAPTITSVKIKSLRTTRRRLFFYRAAWGALSFWMLRQCPGQARAILRAGLDRRSKTAYLLKAPPSPPTAVVIGFCLALAAVAHPGRSKESRVGTECVIPC